MGRPPLPKKERRRATLIVRMTDAERKSLDDAATRAGAESVSDWARDVLLAASTR